MLRAYQRYVIYFRQSNGKKSNRRWQEAHPSQPQDSKASRYQAISPHGQESQKGKALRPQNTLYRERFLLRDCCIMWV